MENSLPLTKASKKAKTGHFGCKIEAEKLWRSENKRLKKQKQAILDAK